MKNKIGDLRNHLFETLEALKDPEKPMEIARAKAISDVAQTIINAARVELKAYEVLDEGDPEKFFARDGEGVFGFRSLPPNGGNGKSLRRA